MKGFIKRVIPVAICLFSLLLCCCANQQQEKTDTEENRQVEKKVTQGLATEGTWNGVTYQYNEDTRTLTVSGKIIKGTIDGADAFSWEDDDKIPWGKWRRDIKELVLEEGVECVTHGAFGYFIDLREIRFPETLKEIGWCAFYNSAQDMKKLELPDSVEEIGDSAFSRRYPTDKGFEQIRLPKKLRRIGRAAFDSQLLTSITIPENVEEIGNWAFGECYWLETVTVKSKKIKKAGELLFQHTNDELAIYVPKEREKKYREMLGQTDGHVYPMKEK